MKKHLRFQFFPWTFPLVAGFLFLFCFGLFINQLGFFWDDWVQLLNKHLYGYPSYMAYFSERPLSGWTHIVFGPWMGDSNIRWELFTLGLRWGCVVSAWCLFKSIWPNQGRAAVLAALLFALYPGFTQQPIAVAYHQHWLQYLLFLLSLLWMVLARQHPKQRAWLISIALVCQVLQLSITEFFVGVELLRPVILWILLNHTPREEDAPLKKVWPHLGKTVLAWIPYLLVFAGYTVWRGFIMPMSPQNQNAPSLFSALAAQPWKTTLSLFNYVLIDGLNSLVVVWGKVFDLRLTNAAQPIIWISWLASLLAAGGLCFYLLRLKPGEEELNQSAASSPFEMIGLGLFGLIISPAPLWLANKNILWAFNEDNYHADRFTLVAMVWIGLLLAGLISWLVERWSAKAVMAALVLGLLVGFQMRNANDYRWLATDQDHFYWQLAWRAPAIQPGTALISEDNLFPYNGLFSTASAINLLYPQAQNPELVDYWMYTLKPRFSANDQGAPYASFDTHQRLYHFVGQTPQSLILSYGAAKENCLWVLRPEDRDYPDLSALLKHWLAVSSLKRIGLKQADTGGPSTQLFGPEPEHGWCYFYEKADLARQNGDWQTAAGLGDQALAKGFSPQTSGSNSIFEWMPVVEAYAHLGRWPDAASVLQKSLKFDGSYAPFICGRWQELGKDLPDGKGKEDANQAVLQNGHCSVE